MKKNAPWQDELEAEEEDFKPLTADEAQAWRRRNPPVSVWRIVKEGMATLQEIETSWSLWDIRSAEAVLDYAADLEYQASQRKDKPL